MEKFFFFLLAKIGRNVDEYRNWFSGISFTTMHCRDIIWSNVVGSLIWSVWMERNNRLCSDSLILASRFGRISRCWLLLGHQNISNLSCNYDILSFLSIWVLSSGLSFVISMLLIYLFFKWNDSDIWFNLEFLSPDSLLSACSTNYDIILLTTPRFYHDSLLNITFVHPLCQD